MSLLVLGRPIPDNVETQSWHIFNEARRPSEEGRQYLFHITSLVEESKSNPPFIFHFAQMGHRIKLLKKLVEHAEDLKSYPDTGLLASHVWDQTEELAVSLVPFIRLGDQRQPLRAIMARHVPGSRGIVIPAGNGNFHLACQLIGNIRDVLRSDLGIELAYGGDKDLSLERRQFLHRMWPDIELVDVTSYLNDDDLELHTGRFAIKPFAALVSRFEQVIVLDADDVFLQRPERFFDDPDYQSTGTMLFHDRAIWPWNDRFHNSWWQTQFALIENLSDNILKSRAMLEHFSEHGESGVVVLDKSRLGVFMGLLHTCWQNTADVRSLVTYVQANGDKESWWFGLEAVGTPYAMEKKYAAALGSECPQEGEAARVCTTNIAHADRNGRLMWWNGGLYKDKSAAVLEYSDIPTVWMQDGKWFPADAGQFSTMLHSHYEYVLPEEAAVIRDVQTRAREIEMSLKAKLS